MKIEFMSDKTGTFKKGIYYKMFGGEWLLFEKATPEEIEVIFCRLVQDDKARRSLLHLSKYFPGDKSKILETFIACNWAKLDNKWDISEKKLQFEIIDCPFKSNNNCPYKGAGLVCVKLHEGD